MILIIRIHGQAELKTGIKETLKRLNIYRKLSATVINEGDEIKGGMLKRVKNYVCYGAIDDKILKEIILKRGETLNGKRINEKEIEKIISGIKSNEWKIKRFFRLHPPIGGFKKSTKFAYPKGILENNKDIAKLVLRML